MPSGIRADGLHLLHNRRSDVAHVHRAAGTGTILKTLRPTSAARSRWATFLLGGPPPGRYSPTMIRALLLTLAALTLSACSMEAMSEKRVPPDVRDEVNAQIDQLITGETQFIFDAFPEDRDNPELRAQVAQMTENVPDGPELSRDVVGVIGSTEQAYSDRKGAIRRGTYNMAYELAFEDGYLLVQTAHTIKEDGECCALRSINATRSDASPMRDDQVGRARLFKFLGIFFLISTLATIAVVVIRIGGKKAREKQMGGE